MVHFDFENVQHMLYSVGHKLIQPELQAYNWVHDKIFGKPMAPIENFGRLKSNEFRFIDYYQQKCPHCVDLQPTFDKQNKMMIDKLQKEGVKLPSGEMQNITFEKKECLDDNWQPSTHQPECQQQGVQAYPSLKLFGPHGQMIDYQGPRSADMLVQFAEDQAKSGMKIKQPTPEEMEKMMMQERHQAPQQDSVVDYYQQACPHCVKIQPQFEKQSQAQDQQDLGVKFIKKECLNADWKPGKDFEECIQEEIQQFPTIKYEGKDGTVEEYHGGRSASDLTKFQEDHSVTFQQKQKVQQEIAQQQEAEKQQQAAQTQSQTAQKAEAQVQAKVQQVSQEGQQQEAQQHETQEESQVAQKLSQTKDRVQQEEKQLVQKEEKIEEQMDDDFEADLDDDEEGLISMDGGNSGLKQGSQGSQTGQKKVQMVETNAEKDEAQPAKEAEAKPATEEEKALQQQEENQQQLDQQENQDMDQPDQDQDQEITLQDLKDMNLDKETIMQLKELADENPKDFGVIGKVIDEYQAENPGFFEEGSQESSLPDFSQEKPDMDKFLDQPEEVAQEQPQEVAQEPEKPVDHMDEQGLPMAVPKLTEEQIKIQHQGFNLPQVILQGQQSFFEEPEVEEKSVEKLHPAASFL